MRNIAELTMIDRAYIGQRFAPTSTIVSKERLRFFAKATGNRNPVFIEDAAAAAAGYDCLPAPPTFAFCLEMMATDDPLELFAVLGIPVGRVLLGELRFTYHASIVAGDLLTFETRIHDIYHKKGGALEILELATQAVNQRGEPVVEWFTALVVRSADGAA